MRYIITGFMLLFSIVAHTATAVWRDMNEEEGKECLCSKKFTGQDIWLSENKYFLTDDPLRARNDYEEFYKSGRPAEMIFGTARAGDGKFYDMFLPSYARVSVLMDMLQADVMTYLHNQSLTKSEKENVIGLYLMPNTTVGLRSSAPYKKVPCTAQGLPDEFLSFLEERIRTKEISDAKDFSEEPVVVTSAPVDTPERKEISEEQSEEPFVVTSAPVDTPERKEISEEQSEEPVDTPACKETSEEQSEEPVVMSDATADTPACKETSEDMLAAGAQKWCVIVNDVFDSGDKEFQLIANVVDEVVQNTTQEQRAAFKVLLSAVYLKNGCDKETEVVFDGKTYPIGVVNFRGSVRARLMAHAKLRVMDDYTASKKETGWLINWFSGGTTKKDTLLAMEEKDRCAVLRDIFDNDSGLELMAHERYLRYVASELIYKFAVNDFVAQKWIDQEVADNMLIGMPTAPVSPVKTLDVVKPLQHLYNQEGIKHFLEPIIWLPSDGVILDEPVNHVNVVTERTGNSNLIEANILELQPSEVEGHHTLRQGWLNLCQSRVHWAKDDTIGVVLLDPYGPCQSGPPHRKDHPNLLRDIMGVMEQELKDNGYNVRFFKLLRNGKFTAYQKGTRTNYPSAERKVPKFCKLIESTVGVIWNAQKLQDFGVYDLRTMP